MELPSLYEYYTSDGIRCGLSANQSYFTLNNRNISIYSGAVHYFRVPQEYWRDRLRKLRAAGLNAVETYVPWNLHEPEPGVYDFGNGGSDFEEFLNIEKFLKLAQEEDLLAIVRPGPYICAEWEFGGLPSWLLRKHGLVVRSSNKYYMRAVERYFRMLFAILTLLQFTNGGPIIAFQIENEYGSLKRRDDKYLWYLRRLFKKNGIVELLFTSDGPSAGNTSQIKDILFTGNFQSEPQLELSMLQSYQPGKPLMVMEYWTGWFDHWSESHNRVASTDFRYGLAMILKYPASINLYMFHGGTSFGFMSGANYLGHGCNNAAYQPDINSYDYDAPLTECGDYTEKYYITKHLLNRYNNIQTRVPMMPALKKRKAYRRLAITQQLFLEELIQQIDYHNMSTYLIPMELLPINNNAGQSYGYIIYRKENLYIPSNSMITIKGHVCDAVIVLINGVVVSKILENGQDLNGFGYWRLEDSQLRITNEYLNATLDFFVENLGRVNYGILEQFYQFKGLWQGPVLLNQQELTDWWIIPLEFKTQWIRGLRGWHPPYDTLGPCLYRAVLKIPSNEEPCDTFIDLRNWLKGIVIVNGFVLSRYMKFGPQQAAYLPAPLLRHGPNEILIFEHFENGEFVKFANQPLYANENSYKPDIYTKTVSIYIEN